MSSDLSQRLSSLSPDRIKALVQKINKNSGSPVIGKISRTAGQRYPLSSAQERMWFLCQLSPGSSIFNNPAVLRAKTLSPIIPERVNKSLDEIGLRHEILRTTFHAENGKPFQLIHETLPLRFAFEDISHLPKAEREQRLENLAYEEGIQYFDLGTGPLVAYKLVRLGEYEYLFLVTSHHIVSDGWSNAMLAKELSMRYSAIELPELEYQYIDYVQWEQDWLRSNKYKEQLNYWLKQLTPETPPLPLPVDYPRPELMSYKGSLESIKLPAPDLHKLREFAREQHISMFQLLIAGLIALLYRYTSQNTISVGTSTANRNNSSFQKVMGLFMNTLVIRTDVDGQQTVQDFLHQVQKICLDALRNQDLPFEKLIGELNPQRSLNVHPVFQVMFVYQNVPALYELPDIQMEVIKTDYKTSKFDLNLWAEEINDELVLTLFYATDLFKASTISRILEHYQSLINAMMLYPVGFIDDLSYFTANIPPVLEYKNTLSCFHDRFELQVKQSPTTIAVDDFNQSLTYSELNTAANQLARYLQDQGVILNDVVSLLLTRSTAMIEAVLGILKANAAYLPLDTTYPTARMEIMLEDARVSVLITEEKFRSLVQQFSLPLLVVYLDSDKNKIHEQNNANLDLPGSPDQLAYIIYTSGTTGIPKGVAVKHKNLMSYCEAIWPVLKLGTGDRCGNISSLASDLGNTMIFPVLMNGGSLVVIPEELTTDAIGLSRQLREHPLAALKIVPSHLQALLQSANAETLIPERLLVLGGEAASVQLIKRIREISPGCRILNHYGPTETTIGVLSYEVPESLPQDGILPLGYALAGSWLIILDKNLNTVPVGITGELFIGGSNVTPGYINQPHLTEERFIPNPFCPNERVYRTGDLAVLREDGRIEFLGRKDRQIKIRGFRIELSEIENILEEYPGIEKAVVLTPEPDDNKQLLRAFVQLQSTNTIDLNALQIYLRKRLPSYMLPGSINLVDSIPINSNGKTDYQALSKFSVSTYETEQRSPRDQLELELTRIWQELLGNDSFGISDNFFDIGGHSLLAVQLMSVIYEKFACTLPLATLFEYGTIESMAELIRAGTQTGFFSPLVNIQAKGSAIPFVFVHPAGGNVLCYYPLSQALGTSQPFYGLQGISVKESVSISSIATAYLDKVKEKFGDTIPLIGGWSMGALVAFEMAILYAQKYGIYPTVAILDQLAPKQKIHESVSELSRLLAFAQKASEFAGQDLNISKELLEFKTPEQQAAVFLDRFIACQLAPATTHVEDFRGFLDLMLIHNQITHEYTPKSYAGRVLVITAENSAKYGGNSETSEKTYPDLGWQQYCSQTVSIISVPGTHVSMMLKPNVQALALQLQAFIAS